MNITAGQWSTSVPVFVEDVEGSKRPAAYYLAESRDGLYVPYVVRTAYGMEADSTSKRSRRAR